MLKMKAVTVLTVFAVAASLNRFAKAEEDLPCNSIDTDLPAMLEVDVWKMIATNYYKLENDCIKLRKTGFSCNDETGKLQISYNMSSLDIDKSRPSGKEVTLLEHNGEFEVKNIDISLQRYLVLKQRKGCFSATPDDSYSQTGTYLAFVFADDNLPSSEVDQCIEHSCQWITNYGECIQTACRRQ